MEWVRLDTSFPTNPKVLELISAKKHAAVVTYVASLAYCGDHETDGFIPKTALKFIHGTPKIGADLVAVGLWNTMPTGFEIPGWTKYQPTKEESENRVIKAKKAAAARWNKTPADGPPELRAVPDAAAQA